MVRNTADTGPLLNVRAIVAEETGACALLTNDRVRCWGEDDYGQLGNGAPLANANLPVTVKGLGSTGVLTGVRSIEGGFGQRLRRRSSTARPGAGASTAAAILGNGDRADVPHPVVVKNLTGSGPLTGVTQISSGGYHGCARLTNGQARCWGDNEHGQLGNGTVADHPLPSWSGGTAAAPLTGVVSIFAGAHATCARVTGGQVRCWGTHTSGQNGDGTIGSPTPEAPHPGANLTDTGNLLNVTQLHMQYAHACVRLSNGEARCWGDGTDGQLGNSDTTDLPLPVKVQI